MGGVPRSPTQLNRDQISPFADRDLVVPLQTTPYCAATDEICNAPNQRIQVDL